MKKINSTVLTFLSFTLLGNGSSWALEFSIESKVDQVEAITVCASTFSNSETMRPICKKGLKSIRDNDRSTEDEMYNFIAELNDRTELFEDGKCSTYRRMCMGYILQDRTRLNISEMDDITIKYTTIGYQFGMTQGYPNFPNQGAYGDENGLITLWAEEQIQYTVTNSNTVILDTIIQKPQAVAFKLECNRAKKTNRCKKGTKYPYKTFSKYGIRNNEWKSSGFEILQDEQGYYELGAEIGWINEPKRRAVRMILDDNTLFGSKISAWTDSVYRNKYYEAISPKRTPIEEFEKSPTFVNDNTQHQTDLSLHEFKRIEGGRAKLALSRLKIFDKAERPAYLNDAKYAGDVQLCVTKVRNSIKSEKNTNSFLSGIASMAGVGEVASVLDAIGTVGTTWDNLSNREQNEVNSCMSYKGH